MLIVRILQYLQQLSRLHLFGRERLQRNGLLVRIVRILYWFVQLLPRVHDRYDRILHHVVSVHVLGPR